MDPGEAVMLLFGGSRNATSGLHLCRWKHGFIGLSVRHHAFSWDQPFSLVGHMHLMTPTTHTHTHTHTVSLSTGLNTPYTTAQCHHFAKTTVDTCQFSLQGIWWSSGAAHQSASSDHLYWTQSNKANLKDSCDRRTKLQTQGDLEAIHFTVSDFLSYLLRQYEMIASEGLVPFVSLCLQQLVPLGTSGRWRPVNWRFAWASFASPVLVRRQKGSSTQTEAPSKSRWGTGLGLIKTPQLWENLHAKMSHLWTKSVFGLRWAGKLFILCPQKGVCVFGTYALPGSTGASVYDSSLCIPPSPLRPPRLRHWHVTPSWRTGPGSEWLGHC